MKWRNTLKYSVKDFISDSKAFLSTGVSARTAYIGDLLANIAPGGAVGVALMLNHVTNSLGRTHDGH